MNEGEIQTETPEYERMLEEERLILAATELVYELMNKEGVTKADLARAVGRTRGYVTQILDGSRNMTLRTLADVAMALGHRVEIDAKPRDLKSAESTVVPSAQVHDFFKYLQRRRPKGMEDASVVKLSPSAFLGEEKKAAVGA